MVENPSLNLEFSVQQSKQVSEYLILFYKRLKVSLTCNLLLYIHGKQLR